MDRRRSDLALGALLALALHGAVLGAIQRWAPPRPGVGEARGEREQPVVVLDAEAARALLEPAVAPRAARLREAGSAPHAPPVQVPGAPELDLAAPYDLPAPAPATPLSSPLPAAATPGRPERLAPPVPAALLPATPERAPPEQTAPGEPPDLGRVGGLVLHRPPLVYPEREERRGVEGVVRVGLEVAPDGAVARAWLLRGSGSRALDRAALENVRAWRFDPAALRAADAGRVFRQDVRFHLR